MTLSNRQVRFDYNGNGSTTVFSFTDKFYGIDVYLSDDSDFSVVEQVLGVDYTVDNLNVGAGGTVTFTTAPASGFSVILKSNTSLVQNVDYVANTNFPAEEQETALDKNVAMIQETAAKLGNENNNSRVLKLSLGVSGDFDTEITTVSGKLLQTNANNDGFNQLAVPSGAGFNDGIQSVTAAVAIALSGLEEFDTLLIEDRGSSLWDVISGTTGANGFDLIQCTGVPSLQLSLRVYGGINVLAYGAVADWNGSSGTDNSGAIQQAIDSVGLGESITIDEYGFFYSSGLSLISKQIRGSGTMIKDSSVKDGITMDGTGSVVDGITFEPFGASTGDYNDIKMAEGCESPTVKNCCFNGLKTSGTKYNAVIGSDFGVANSYTDRVIRPKVIDNIFIGYQRPLYVSSMESALVSGNSFRDSTRDGIRTLHNSGHTIITNNIFKDVGKNAPGGETADGIDTNLSGEDLTISNNKFLDSWVIGIDIKGYSNETGVDFKGKSSKIIITGNEIIGSGLSAISAYSVDDLTGFALWPYNYNLIITDNIITKTRYQEAGNDSGAIWIRGGYKGIIIANNCITSNNTRGIYIQKDSDDPVDDARVKYINITDNIVFNNYLYGLHFTDSKYMNVNSNVFGNDASMSEDGEPNSQVVGMKIITTDAAAVGRTCNINNNHFVGNTGSPYEITTMDIIKGWMNNTYDNTGAVTAGYERFINPVGQLFFGDGNIPSGSFGDFDNSVVINYSSTLAIGDYLFSVKLASGSWGKTGLIIAH